MKSSDFPSGAGGVWFGPALAVIVAVLLIWKPFEGAPPQEDLAVAEGPHLSGTLVLETGGRLRVSLDPLHEDPRRQVFDGVALAERLGLGEGAPWMLRIETGGDAPRAALEGVQVIDVEGACLMPILAGVSPTDDVVQDPLRGLFHPTAPTALLPRWEVVLWGRAPAEGGRLECSWGATDLIVEEMEEEGSQVVDGSEGPVVGSSEGR